MAFIDAYDFENLVDEGRVLVIKELGRQLENYPENICMCNECVVDMAAFALNALPPRYTSSLLGELYQGDADNDPVYAQKLHNAVKTAIKRVSSAPGHDLK